jgi:cation transporter-like permease
MSDMSTWKVVWREMVADARKLSIGGYLVIGILLALLAGTFVLADLAWSLGQGTDVSAFGYAAMAGGIVFTVVLGIGLMTLCFWSSRFGRDEPTKLVRPQSNEHLPKDKHRGS